MTEFSKLEIISRENAQLRRELQNALDALRMTRDRLIEAQEELRNVKWALVRLEEAKVGKHS